jgi:Domain of unknown function (DUF4202)
MRSEELSPPILGRSGSPADRLAAVLAAIDAANAADPTVERDGDAERPAALLYGWRMSAELARQAPGASDLLQIAARGQHVERWKLSRADFPEGRAGYLAWRIAEAQFHADRVGAIMEAAGYSLTECSRVGKLLRKEGLKHDFEVQRLEDVICFVFLRYYVAGFAEGRDPAQLLGIVTKTARKMSEEARERVLREFTLPPELAAAFAG